MSGKRSRTGCLTCRQRSPNLKPPNSLLKLPLTHITELKCSEERPRCAQCAKANRECIPSSGITFRHQQNPSMNGADHGEGSLKSFYGYKETFNQDTVWVDVPRELRFVNTTNPYEDDENGPGGGGGYIEADTSFLPDPNVSYDDHALHRSLVEYDYPRPTSYPEYATHGLEALSAVASASQDHYSYMPPPPTSMSQHEPAQPQSQLQKGNSRKKSSQAHQNFNIDPRLDWEVRDQHAEPGADQTRDHDPDPTVAQFAETLLGRRS